LHVTYRGKTSNLQTSAEIAAWIAERRKRFPTQAKIEEKKKAMEEAKKTKEEVQRQREARKQAAKREKKQQQDKQSTNQHPRAALDPADAAAKAKRKAEKLRRKLEKEEKRIAEAEADAERARNLQESQKGTLDATTEPTTTTQNEGEHSLELDGQGQDARNSLAGSNLSGVASQSKDESLVYDGTVGDSVSDTSDSSDWTSSSGSDTSSDSDNGDDDSAPEQATSRREGPERVPPPPREGQNRLCRHFARTGRCVRGKNCKFLHEKPEHGGKTKPAETKGRKGLLQAVSADCTILFLGATNVLFLASGSPERG
jgi:hypothetical protein